MEKNKRIGFFGGTFDPFHIGHIQLALILKEKAFLDEVFFCPTFLSPTKVNSLPHASAKDRLEMVRRGIQDIKGFQVIEEEIHQNHPSYTIDTIRLLYKKHADTQFHLLLGQDQLPSLTVWKNWEQLIQLAPPIVGIRSVQDRKNPLQLETVEIPLLDISATDIRERFQKGLYVKHLLPILTFEYINKKKLYL